MVIADIEGEENKNRKREQYRRYEIYKDLVSKYVIETYRREQGEKAAKEIQYRTSNIGVCKTIVNKKAMLYTSGVRREVFNGDEKSQEQIDKVVDLLNFNSAMRKVNRYEELHRNTVVQVYPYLDSTINKWKIKLNLLQPFKYDVIEDANNPEQARAYILSYLTSNDLSGSGYYAEENLSAIHPGTYSQGSNSFRSGDSINQSIANAPIDAGVNKKEYIWCSTHYYFTTDEKGEIIPGKQEDTLENQISTLQFVNFAADQDGAFWSLGGEDIIDGSIVTNVFLTDLYYVAKYQGMGIFYFFGKGVPKSLRVGPSQAVTLEVKEGDPTPQIGFASANPPLDNYTSAIKEYISALLRTNGLEPSAIIGLDSAASATSGVQELIKRSTLIEEQEDKKELYRDNEPKIFDIYIKWHNYLFDRGLLADEFAEIGRISEDVKVNLKFNPPQSVLTELEKLEIISKRQELGLDSQIDSIMRDNPELTEEQAEEKYLKILENKVKENRSNLFNSVGGENGQMVEQGDIQSRSDESTGGDTEEQENDSEE